MVKKNKRGTSTDKMEMLQWGIDNKASDEEIAKHFGYELSSWRVYKRMLKKLYPSLLEQLSLAQGNAEVKDIASNNTTGRLGVREECFALSNLKGILAKNEELREENAVLKAQIVQLKLQLLKYKGRIARIGENKKETAEEKQTAQLTLKSTLDILLQWFDTGIITQDDADIVRGYYQEIQNRKEQYEKVNSGVAPIEYANMGSLIRTMFETKQRAYKEKIEPELGKYISSHYYGPMYEIKEETSISELANRIRQNGIQQVSTINLAMLINQMQAKGQKVSHSINLEKIQSIRTKIQDWHEKLAEDMGLGLDKIQGQGRE